MAFRRASIGLVAVAILLSVLSGVAVSEGGKTAGESGGSSHGNADSASPNMLHTANRANPRRTNSDMGFWTGGLRGRSVALAAVANYDGFRLFDVANPDAPVLLSAVACRGPQSDVSFHRTNDRLLLIQSVDRPQTTAQCTGAFDTPLIRGIPSCEATPEFPEPDCPTSERQLAQPGFEGLRIFDVTTPMSPVHIASVPTPCGSHTHTTVADDRSRRALVYVSSYPTGTSPTPRNASEFDGPPCTIPHARVSIVEVPDRRPEEARLLRAVFLHADTRPFLGSTRTGGTGAIGCHDIAVYEGSGSRRVAAAACLEEGQLWDLSDPANPTALGPHSHIRNPYITSGVPGRLKGYFSTARFTWDGRVVIFSDESSGGGGHGCDGPQDTRGNLWFYGNVPPGTANVAVYGRYMIPRAQPAIEVCTLHYGNVIPTDDGYYGVAAAYEGGTTVFDFTGVLDNRPIFLQAPRFGDTGDPRPVPPIVAREVAFFDAQGVDGRGRDDVWAAYWFNDRIFANGGLLRQSNSGGRGLDVYKLLARGGRLVGDDGEPTFRQGDDPNDPTVSAYRARRQRWSNPQTQEVRSLIRR